MDSDWSMWPAMGCYDSDFDTGLMLDAVYSASTTPPTTSTDLDVLHSISGPSPESQCQYYATDAQGMTTNELLFDWLEGFASPPEVPLTPESTPPPEKSVRAALSGSKGHQCTKLDASGNLDDSRQNTDEGSTICRIPVPSSNLLADRDGSCRQGNHTPNGVAYHSTIPVDVSDSPRSSSDSDMPSIRLRSSTTRADNRTSFCHDSKRKQLKDQGCGRASHNLVERKYRNGLNDKFMELIAALGKTNEHGECSGSSSGRKALSKGNVLTMARKQLQVLQAENRSLNNEVQRLGTLLYARRAANVM